MGVFDDDFAGSGDDRDDYDTDQNGDYDDDRDGPDDDNRGGQNGDRDSGGRRDSRDGDARDGDPRPRRRNRPGSRQRQGETIRDLRGQLDALTEAVRSSGLQVNASRPTRQRGEQQPAVDVDALRRQLTEEITASVRGTANEQIVSSRAETLLERAGFKGNVERGISMLDLRGIDPGDRDALLDAIDDLKDDSPELFGRRSRSRARRDYRNDERDDDGYSDDDGFRPRESRDRDDSRSSGRPAASRERMSNSRDRAPETDSLAETLSRAVGGGRRSR